MFNSIRDCFITGKWDETQDAATLLKQDGKKCPMRGGGKQLKYDVMIELMMPN